MNTVETSRVAESPCAVASNLNSLKDEILWGVKAISEEINRSPRQTFHMLETRHLPARKVGGVGRFFGRTAPAALIAV